VNGGEPGDPGGSGGSAAPGTPAAADRGPERTGQGRRPGLLRALRRERPPREALTGLLPDERVLTFATLPGGAVVVATRRGLWLPDREERLLPWHRINHARWRAGVLTLVEGAEVPDELPDGVLEDLPPRDYPLQVPRRLPQTVRQRVENSIGYSAHHDLHPSGGVRIVGRRVAGRDGLTWYVVFDAGTDRDDPLVRAQAEQFLAHARSVTGL
jgi:hypothetical protein